MWVTEGINRCWYTPGRRTPRGRREKPNDWLGPQNGSGDPFPSAEVNSKKFSFWAGSVAGRRTIGILLRVEDKRKKLRHEGPQVLQASVKKNRTKAISPWKKKKFSSGTPSKKNKISNFGAIFLYTQILYTTLSLSQFEERQKSRKDIYIRGLSIYYMFWHFESIYNCSKGIDVFLCYHVVYVVLCRSTTNLLLSHFLFSFYSPYVILLRIVPLIPKISHGKPELPTTTI